MTNLDLPHPRSTTGFMRHQWQSFCSWVHHQRLVAKYSALRKARTIFVCFTDGRPDSTILKPPRVFGRTWVVAGPGGQEQRVDSALIDTIGDEGVYGY